MDPLSSKLNHFTQKLLLIGFGSIGQAVLPLIFRHLELKASQITIITKDDEGASIAREYGVKCDIFAMTKHNYRQALTDRLSAGDFLLNLSVDVSSIDLIKYCQAHDVLYLDTCSEPWEGGYVDSTLPPAMRSNYALREAVLALKKLNVSAPTALVTHGANPGLISHFAKQALVNIAKETDRNFCPPQHKAEWADLACKLGIKAIHIAERDTQIANKPKSPGEFVNTWSVDGFVSEGSQPAELGWGTHEKHWPKDGFRHDFGTQCAIYLNRPGAATRVRTWTPLSGAFHGFLITHGESISMADYFTKKDKQNVLYRPTVHYAYHPCEDAVLSLHELSGREWQQQSRKRLLFNEIIDGYDELGVLLMGHAKGAYWYGSQLSIHQARKLAPYNNATSLQVAISVLAGMLWVIEHPHCGIVEPDDIDYAYILRIAMPYLGTVIGHYTDWTPLKERERLFTEEIDRSDPWQFINMRVV